jgi:PEP-CTERM motif-containing protein
LFKGFEEITMKTITLARSTAFVFMASLSAGALATPVFTGPTDANFITNPGASSAGPAGYYIWSSNSGNDWSVRWTGNDNGTSANYDWFGTINLQNLTDGTLSSVEFEVGDDSVQSFMNVGGSALDIIDYDAYAGPAWDGFDFSITNPSSTQVIDFSLGSELFNLSSDDLGKDVAGQNIFLGSAFSIPLVQIQEEDPTVNDSRLVQRFEVTQQVPEPGTLALLGLGLVGLTLRKKARTG